MKYFEHHQAVMGLTQSATSAPPPQRPDTKNPTTATATATTTASQKANDRLRREFDKLFADMEFRCRRAAMMNYHEAERYDSRSQYLQTGSAIIGALGVSGIGASIAKTKRMTASSAGMAGMLALPLCGILQFLSNGTSNLAPTVAEKAKLHVQAGAGWQRIARLTRAYRIQLKHLPEDQVDSPVLSLWYREIVESSEAVSKILPIHADTYSRFEQPEAVTQRISKRETLLQKYMDMDRIDQR